ncbi:SGNH/GDSL hydrolase family protein [Stackebrandtia nassauensis]|uniref:Lipolytic protein G-D-S-L family n=1 Tax=Stackebrandtia nassauensis (strain DSM 44728 / CIP 108903 / NRRL B-16338 / NBRC 102104 / LLR-40K-21) TaxID=446470 RepID=D3Q758_STANL|nr:SGNH/GDSL hydrolase family protein [Stackebrandtia nassauensis]ADD42329.1 lipolytic protein G-D-S-L family [Stackebrandtia nassauensis DSM 44728]
MLSRPWRLFLVGLASCVLLASAQAPAGATGDVPSSMAALGDSLTRGFNSCGWLFDCTVRSWSTGDSEQVASHYSRILAVNPEIQGNVYNNAQTGADSNQLVKQAQKAVRQQVEYVTILIGANDVCALYEERVTPTDKYRSNVDAGLAVLRQGLPDADILVLSVPDVVRLWEIGRADPEAVRTWKLAKMCETVLANPTSDAPVDVDRRERMGRQVDEYNVQLEEACRDYGPKCRFDGGLVHNYPFTLEQMSKWDYFHLNAAGQAAISQATYQWLIRPRDHRRPTRLTS